MNEYTEEPDGSPAPDITKQEKSYGLWEIWVLIVGSIIIISGLAGYVLFDYLVEE